MSNRNLKILLFFFIIILCAIALVTAKFYVKFISVFNFNAFSF